MSERSLKPYNVDYIKKYLTSININSTVDSIFKNYRKIIYDYYLHALYNYNLLMFTINNTFTKTSIKILDVNYDSIEIGILQSAVKDIDTFNSIINNIIISMNDENVIDIEKSKDTCYDEPDIFGRDEYDCYGKHIRLSNSHLGIKMFDEKLQKLIFKYFKLYLNNMIEIRRVNSSNLIPSLTQTEYFNKNEFDSNIKGYEIYHSTYATVIFDNSKEDYDKLKIYLHYELSLTKGLISCFLVNSNNKQSDTIKFNNRISLSKNISNTIGKLSSFIKELK